MSQLTQFGRLLHLWRVYRRNGLSEALGKPPKRNFDQPIGVRLRTALEQLGPVFIKFGQALSTRPDILPPEIAAELRKLQDKVPPFDGAEARAIVERNLGQPIGKIFDTFDDRPLASASIAQVHAARLKGVDGQPGMDVVVKVRRPGIAKQVERDVALLHTVAGLAAKVPDHGRRLRPSEVVAEYEHVIRDELDFVREAANASQLRRNWLASPYIYHPIILWQYTTEEVIVMERIYGVPIDQTDKLRELGFDFEKLAGRGVEIFFKEVFYYNFFHADMHPGNVMVDPERPTDPRYLALDFGIVGALTPEDQRYLAENFLAFFNQDYRRVAELHVESGWVPANTRVDEFTGAIRAVCEPIFDKPLGEISFGKLLIRLFTVARRFEMTVQPQLVLLQKTILQIEGLGRQLYPELDLMKTAKPIMEQWMRDRMNPMRAVEQAKLQLPGLMADLPRMAQHLRSQLDGGPNAPLTRRALDEFAQRMAAQQARSRRVWMGGALVVSAAVIYGLDGFRPLMLGDAPLVTWLLGGLGLALWWSGRGSQ